MNNKVKTGVNSQETGVNSQETGVVVKEIQSTQNSVEKIAKNTTTITIDEICSMLGKEKIEKTLPNQKVITTFDWKVEELSDVYNIVNKYREEKNLGVDDLIIIDGGMPTWLLPVISHAFHPVSTAVNYPQGNKFLGLSGYEISGEGSAEGLKFNIEDKGNYTLVEFNLTEDAIDVDKTLETLIAPEIKMGKGIVISGRGPIAIATSLAETYAHKVPFVANFQPGTGAVVSISHSGEYKLGDIIEM